MAPGCAEWWRCYFKLKHTWNTIGGIRHLITPCHMRHGVIFSSRESGSCDWLCIQITMTDRPHMLAAWIRSCCIHLRNGGALYIVILSSPQWLQWASASCSRRTPDDTYCSSHKEDAEDRPLKSYATFFPFVADGNEEAT